MSVTATNPILSGFYPDPSICAVGEDFYLVNSSFAYFPGLPILHSKDLAHWEQIGNVLDRDSQLPLDDAEVSRGLFAPTIRYYDGVFYVICTNVSFGGNFIVTATDPKGPWSEPHYLEDADGIDPSLFFDEDGKCYYCGTHPNPDGPKYDGDWYIYIQELDIKNFKLIGEKHNVWNGALKGCIWPEGPHIYHIGEYYYIIHAEGGTGPDHAICTARSKDIFGPYENNPRNPIFTHRHLGVKYPIKYVGHGDLVQTVKGDYYMTLLAVRPANGYTTMGRETFLARVIMEEGWPLVNPGLGILSHEVIIDLPEFKPECDIRLTPLSDKHYEFGKLEAIPYNFMSLREPMEGKVSLCEEGINLLCEKDKINYVCIRQDAHVFEAVAVLRTGNLFDGPKAGMVLFQNSKYHLRLEFAGYTGTVYKTVDGVEEKLGSMMVAEDKVSLFIGVKGTQASIFIGSGNKVEPIVRNVDVSELSTEVAGGFVGCTVGLYATDTQDRDEKIEATFKSFSYRPIVNNK